MVFLKILFVNKHGKIILAIGQHTVFVFYKNTHLLKCMSIGVINFAILIATNVHVSITKRISTQLEKAAYPVQNYGYLLFQCGKNKF